MYSIIQLSGPSDETIRLSDSEYNLMTNRPSSGLVMDYARERLCENQHLVCTLVHFPLQFDSLKSCLLFRHAYILEPVTYNIFN